MIQITKREAEHIRKHAPHAHIKRTVSKYYVEDTAAVRNALRNMNRGAVQSAC